MTRAAPAKVEKKTPRTEPEAKPAPRVEAKPEVKPDPKPAPKVEAKVEPKTAPKVEAKVEAKVEPKPAPKAAPRIEVSLEPEPKPLAKIEVKIDPKANQKKATKSEGKGDPKPADPAPSAAAARSVRVRLVDGSTVIGLIRAELAETLVIDCNLGLLSIPRTRIAMIAYDAGTGGAKRAPVQQLDDDLPPPAKRR